jgi:ATP-dependent exoDNAse (exonuclease V) beta subunit
MAGGQCARQCRHPRLRLARRIAATIRGWLDSGETLKGKGRPIRPGDILILVRNRTTFMDALVRALKQENIEVAGADRLVLTQHIAIEDLLALARFTLLPDDDLTLASVLKSPLVAATTARRSTTTICSRLPGTAAARRCGRSCTRRWPPARPMATRWSG